MPNDTNPVFSASDESLDTSASTDVYAVHGADPEVLAYGMAKYSRSSLSLRESLAELNEQKAEKFLNTFYFQYGHRSIADLAHIAFAIEKLSILAATVLVDEPRWDGQERSTRYQDFQKSGYYVPEFAGDAAVLELYRDTVDLLFAEYRHFSEAMFRYLKERTPKPEEMKQDAYERTLQARAFDLSRYLLPMATNTSLGQIVSARTLENQVSRLLSDPHAEVRKLGELLKKAARDSAYNVNHASAERVLHEVQEQSAELAERVQSVLLREVHSAPTLMKYAEPNVYDRESRRELTAAAAELLGSLPIDRAPLVDLLEDEPLEVELATTLLYQYSHHSYRQIRGIVEGLSGAQRARRSSILACATVDATTKLPAPIAAARSSASTFSWTSAASATCTAIAAACRSCRSTPRCTATTVPKKSMPRTSRRAMTQLMARARAAAAAAGCADPQRRPASSRSTSSLSPTGSARSSRWTSPRLSTSANCVPALRDTSVTATSPMRCMRQWHSAIRSWRSTSASRTFASQSTCLSGNSLGGPRFARES